jgi:hypothetical protein
MDNVLEIAAMVVAIIAAVATVVFILVYNAALLVAITVYPFKFIRRAYRIHQATSHEFDRDGHRKMRDEHGFHYVGRHSMRPIYPLDGYYWPQKRDSFTNDPKWCVTKLREDEYYFCRRDGRSFGKLPKPLRDHDPKTAYKALRAISKGKEAPDSLVY